MPASRRFPFSVPRQSSPLKNYVETNGAPGVHFVRVVVHHHLIDKPDIPDDLKAFMQRHDRLSVLHAAWSHSVETTPAIR